MSPMTAQEYFSSRFSKLEKEWSAGHLPALYDAVVAMTNGGPGDATDVPTKFIMDNLFERQNIGLASAASATMLVTVVIIVAPLLYARSRAKAAAGRP